MTMPEKSTPDLKEELINLMRKKRSLIENLSSLENRIYQFESNYLDDTAPYGNIIKGWENFLLTASSGSAFSAVANGVVDKKSRKFRESDRLFSRSSVTSGSSTSSFHNVCESENREISAINEIYDAQHYENDPNAYMASPVPKKKRRHR